MEKFKNIITVLALQVTSYKLQKKGQSLLEIIIAVAVAALTIVATITILTLILRISEQDIAWQTAAFLQRRLSDGVAITAERDWRQVGDTLSNRRYRLAATAADGVFKIEEGLAATTIGGVIYSQFLTVEEVKRDSNGNIADVGAPDPSTKKVNIFTAWPVQNGTATATISRYVTRVQNSTLIQTDWSGGATTPGDPTMTVTGNEFFQASPNIDFSSQPGSVRIRN